MALDALTTCRLACSHVRTGATKRHPVPVPAPGSFGKVGGKEPLQVRIPVSVKRRFKSHAALLGMEPNELFVVVWERYEAVLKVKWSATGNLKLMNKRGLQNDPILDFLAGIFDHEFGTVLADQPVHVDRGLYRRSLLTAPFPVGPMAGSPIRTSRCQHRSVTGPLTSIGMDRTPQRCVSISYTGVGCDILCRGCPDRRQTGGASSLTDTCLRKGPTLSIIGVRKRT